MNVACDCRLIPWVWVLFHNSLPLWTWNSTRVICFLKCQIGIRILSWGTSYKKEMKVCRVPGHIIGTQQIGKVWTQDRHAYNSQREVKDLTSQELTTVWYLIGARKWVITLARRVLIIKAEVLGKPRSAYTYQSSLVWSGISNLLGSLRNSWGISIHKERPGIFKTTLCNLKLIFATAQS